MKYDNPLHASAKARKLKRKVERIAAHVKRLEAFSSKYSPTFGRGLAKYRQELELATLALFEHEMING